jgi:DNA-binding beta-propeller fold protein YncE
VRKTLKRIVYLFVGLVGLALWAKVPKALSADLLVSNQGRRTVNRLDAETGAFLGDFAVLETGNPLGLAFGPDSNLYVTDNLNNQVLRFNGATGASMGTFAAGNGLDFPQGLTFGPDGNLYVASANSGTVLRFDGTTGAFINVFVTSGSGGLSYPRGLKFGPDGNLYVVSYITWSVLRYSGTTGAFLDAFVPTGSGGLFTPVDLVFGPDGNLYVTGGVFGSLGVRRYNGTTGAFMDLFAAMPCECIPYGVAFGPNGDLYVTGNPGPGVSRFAGTTGRLIGDFVPEGVSAPFFLTFFPPNKEPDCSLAVASTPELWPPNHGLVPVTVDGVTAPDGGPLSIKVTAVTQDEALDSGGGNTCPDAVVSDGAIHVRAERSGKGHGRVYSISFVASNAQGGSCTGEVEVCVPHDKGAGHSCVKDDLAVSSLGPCDSR